MRWFLLNITKESQQGHWLGEAEGFGGFYCGITVSLVFDPGYSHLPQ
jgi:hypothetical protein